MTKHIYTSYEFQGGATATGIPTPVNSSDAVPKNYVDSIAAGISWKESVRAASTANVTIANPATAIFDTVTLIAGDRLLLKNQTAPEENGIYVFNGASSPLTRSLDADTFASLEAAIVTVEEGAANAGTSWRQTQVNGVLGTDDILFTPFIAATPDATETTAGKVEVATQSEVNSGAATGGSGAPLVVTPETLNDWDGRLLRFAANVGDGSNNSFTITHNFGTRDVSVAVYKNSGSYDDVEVSVQRPSTNAVVLNFAPTVPTTNQFRVVILA